jgi:hypothetical protein
MPNITNVHGTFSLGDRVVYSSRTNTGVYEGLAVVVLEGVEAIEPTRELLRPDVHPVCFWDNIFEVRHVADYVGMGYEAIFEKYAN